ncbi:hypothetical protein [Nocardia asteroides]|uniref:hypothetical protein n=1 Tax=Nocardia asteroides TaxID=1824 RepID=UPI001E4BAE77|nr:hypothetical protein [Nocardia asteroides]UGT62664.1 hypothetical protein LTT61_04770 [Nocardia asteroides]
MRGRIETAALARADQECAQAEASLDDCLAAVAAAMPRADRVTRFMQLTERFASTPETESLAVFAAAALTRLGDAPAPQEAADDERSRSAATLLAETERNLADLCAATAATALDRTLLYVNLVRTFVRDTEIGPHAALPTLTAAAVLRLSA